MTPDRAPYRSNLEALQALRAGLALRVAAAKGVSRRRLLAQLAALDVAIEPVQRRAERDAVQRAQDLARREERRQLRAEISEEITEAKARQASQPATHVRDRS